VKLKTIWTMPAMAFKERINRTKEWAALAVAVMLPKRVRYWVTVSEIAKATIDSPNIPATPLEEIMRALEKDW
jgi:hypothetical protein